MSDYRTADKTNWFIHKMMGGWFSRPEIVDLAEKRIRGDSSENIGRDDRTILVGQREPEVGNLQSDSFARP